MHVVMMIGDYRTLHHAVPLVARSTNCVIIGVDYRTPLRDRLQAVYDHAPEVTSMEGAITVDPLPIDCEQDLHDWQRVVQRGLIRAWRCTLCRAEERAKIPLPDLTRMMHAAS